MPADAVFLFRDERKTEKRELILSRKKRFEGTFATVYEPNFAISEVNPVRTHLTSWRWGEKEREEKRELMERGGARGRCQDTFLDFVGVPAEVPRKATRCILERMTVPAGSAEI